MLKLGREVGLEFRLQVLGYWQPGDGRLTSRLLPSSLVSKPPPFLFYYPRTQSSQSSPSSSGFIGV